jgi:TPR repeat protein
MAGAIMRNVLEAALLTPTLVLALSMSAVAGPLEDAYEPYERGDYAIAVLLFRPLAEQGNAQAQAQLGFMFNSGRGVPQDYEQAAAWYRRSAEGGNAAGQYNLAMMYDKGHGVPQDYAQVVLWYRKSAS